MGTAENLVLAITVTGHMYVTNADNYYDEEDNQHV